MKKYYSVTCNSKYRANCSQYCQP